MESHFDIVDKFSSPGAAGQHLDPQADFELDTAFLPVHRLPDDNWLKHVEIEGSLDYVATGLPGAVGASR